MSLALALSIWLAVAAVGPVQSARAGTTVTVGNCDAANLDSAVAEANADNDDATVNFVCSGTMDLTSTLDITSSMTIDGTGQQIVIDGQQTVGVFSVASGVTFAMTDLTVEGGATAESGAGLDNDGGTVTITDSTFEGNIADDAGGAIDNDGGTVTITDSTLFQNRSLGNDGGAVHSDDGGTLTVSGSFFWEDWAGAIPGGTNGGAIAAADTALSITSSSFYLNIGGDGGAVLFSPAGGTPTLSITNSSFGGNEADTDGGAVYVGSDVTATLSFDSFFDNSAGENGGTLFDGGVVSVLGSIFDDGSPDNCLIPPADEGYNLESGTDCGFTGTGDLQNANPLLFFGPPQQDLYQGQGSPGIDAVPLALCPPTDENGNPRPANPSETACDMGATQSDYAAAATTTSLTSSADPSTYGQAVTFTATVTPTDGGGTVAFTADGSPIAGCGAETLAEASGTWTATCTTAALPAGSHVIGASYSGDSSYAGSPATLAGGQTVNPAPLTITASAGTMTYGGTPPAITPSYSGFVNGDDVGSLTTDPACSTTATAASDVGTYPSSCSGAADGNYAISYVNGQVTVTPAATTLAYTGPQSVSSGASLTPAAALSSPAGACQAGQPVSFTLNVNPATGAAGPYSLGSATTDGTGAATASPVSTSGWQAGAYTITASYAGTADCGASSATEPLAVTSPGLAAAGAGSYPLAGVTVRFGFIVAQIPHTSAYLGGISLVDPGAWQLTGSLNSYTKSSSTQGTLTGTGSLYWWDQSLNKDRGGWELAKTGVAFTVSFSATTKTSPGAFGIQISYTPVSPQPSGLPDSSPVSLQSGVIVMA